MMFLFVNHKILSYVSYLCKYNQRLLHDIFHIGTGISPGLPYQTQQRRWRADMGRGILPGSIWKFSVS